MNSSSYKDIVNSRGYKYHYYAVPAKDKKPTILFVHGFPQTSRDWRLIAPFFEAKGYGVIAPDMLAYGGTDKPTDLQEYLYTRLGKDIVDILDAEGVKQAIAIGHDWGSGIVSRLSNMYPEHFMAYAFISVSYIPPNPDFTLEDHMVRSKSYAGYDNYGYWLFFSEEGADKLIDANLESFICATFAKDPAIMKDQFAAVGALKKNLINGFKAPVGDYMTGEDKRIWMDTFRKGGFAAPLSYYKIMASGGRRAEDAKIPTARMLPPLSSPLFFGATLRDPVCLAGVGKFIMAQDSLKHHNITIKDLDGDHWLMLVPETADVTRRELLAWIEDVVIPSQKARV